MHEAYDVVSVIANQQHQCAIECMTSYGERLIIGTKNGFALVYLVKPQGGSSYDITLDRTIKSFSKKPVMQMEAVPELEILISLSDNIVSIYELKTLKQMPKASASLAQTKGATVFNVDIQKLKTLDGTIQYNLRLCIAVRKKLQLYYWKVDNFVEYREELSLPDTPKALCLCEGSVCVGFKREYYILKIEDGSLTELFNTGKSLEPIIARLDRNKMALTKDNMSILIDDSGKPVHTYGIMWSETPVAVTYRQPYLIGVLPKFVEIRTIEPKLLIQNMKLDSPRIMCHSRDGAFYVGSPVNVWRLVFVSVGRQIKQLLDNKEFELALRLSEQEGETRELHSIKNLHAFELFSQKRFEESLKIFSSIRTDPSHVIGMYPDLLPREFRDSLRFPRELPDLRGSDLEKSLVSLIEYLTQKRLELQKMANDPNASLNYQPLMDDSPTVKSIKQLSSIIDTTLLKCYVEINDALVAPLLRLKDNSCHVQESETVLLKKDKLDDLIILYETKGLHRKALKMLTRQSRSPSAPETLRGVERTVDYLQRLGKNNIDIILEYADWVLKSDFEKGLSIFTEDLGEVENLPRDKVLSFLLTYKSNHKLTIPYLLHLITEWKEERPEFHDSLVKAYCEEITPLLIRYVESLPEGHRPRRAGKEEGRLGELRQQLLHFLRTSKYYRAERVIKDFPLDYYPDERVILLGRLGNHKQALSICINHLDDKEMAEKYCRTHYKPDVAEASDVYVYLLSYYLRPRDGISDNRYIYGAHLPQDVKPKREDALDILKVHSSKLESSKVLKLLPDNVYLYDILPYLEKVIEKREVQKRHGKIMKNLLHAERLTAEQARITCERVKFSVTERSLCYVCQNKISTRPDGQLAHFSCLNDTA